MTFGDIAAPQTVKKMHISMCISSCMCNKNVQVLSIHGKKLYLHTNVHINVHVFPVYGRNLHIFITHMHTNVHINVHFYLTICGAPTTAAARPLSRKPHCTQLHKLTSNAILGSSSKLVPNLNCMAK